MKTLMLFRHAKAAQATLGQEDFERPLTDRGRRDATRMGRLLAPHHPDHALVSSAARTRETWTLASAEIKNAPEPELTRGLYLCGPERLIASIREIPDAAHRAVIVGHNPDIQEVALWLAGHGESHAVREMRHKFPTAAIAIFRLDIEEWEDCAPKKAALERFASPADSEDGRS